jgi:serine/threonine protein kinase/O-acetyl-ADP-ribose deacetylase (regulator of RNase III)
MKLKHLPTWKVAGPDYCSANPLPKRPPLFPVNDAINDKVSFWMRGDSARLEVDAIVNSANSSLSSGNGICGVIHAAAGPELEKACSKISENGKTPTGQAALTPGFLLPAKHVIHAVGPTPEWESVLISGEWEPGPISGECESALTSAYQSTLAYLDGSKIKSIGFCCISTGIQCYPIQEATHIALRTVREFLDDPANLDRTDRIVFVVYDTSEVAVYYSLAPLYFPLAGLSPKPEVNATRPGSKKKARRGSVQNSETEATPGNSYLAHVAPPSEGDISRFYVQIQDYQVCKSLARGSFGLVCEARHTTTHELVAIKRLACNVSDPRFKQSFDREVQIMATVRHPAVLTLHGYTPFVQDSDKPPSILTPFMSQGSLDAMLKLEREGKAPSGWNLTRKQIVLLGVASGMMFMREHRIIHRDLKPQNILLDDNLEPKIGDFGLSKFVECGATRKQTMHDGTPICMAPEIFDGKDFDFKAEVYAFGVVMYMVVTGLEPFPDAKTPWAIPSKVTAGERPKIPESTPSPFAELIRECWHQGPERRPEFKEIVARLGKADCLVNVDLEVFKKYQYRVCPPELIPPIERADSRNCHKRL